VVQKTYGWVQDPLHQWSRQWEYPFVLQYIARELNSGTTDRPEILDAGSGITFFPFYLKMRWPDASVTCCDYDNSLSRIYSQVQASLVARSQIEFRVAPMQRLPFDDGQFSILYCVSVLEHTTDYLGIVREFHRVLRPGGLFLATFDISLDGVSEILPAEADHLHESILSHFQLIDPTRNPSAIPAAGVTSERLGEVNRALLPWRYPLLSMVKSAIKRRRVPVHWRKRLTVFCCSYRKPE
jgi:SAM-dependent methyltransferase